MVKELNPILIVGAGPTGLTLANDLARRNVPFDIIDIKNGPTTDSKGLALNVASQYTYHILGLKDSIGKTGQKIRRLNILWNDKRLSHVNFDHLPTEIKYLITQPQYITEAFLLQSLESTGKKVHWQNKLIELQDKGDHVVADVEAADGKVKHKHYRYVVGCDGKRSIVREKLDTQFEGSDYPMHFVLGDFKLDWDYPHDEVFYYVYDHTFFIIIPIGNSLWRIVVKNDGDIPAQPVSVDDIAQVITPVLGEKATLGEAKWISRAPFYNRVSSRLLKNRIMIAGDAAHLFSPIGGTGMNTGIQDAVNLGWKLAFIYHGISDESLLRSYEKERLPAIQAAATAADNATRLITRHTTVSESLENLLPRMKNRIFLKNILPKLYAGLSSKIPVESVVSVTIPSYQSKVGEVFLPFFHLAERDPSILGGNACYVIINGNRVMMKSICHEKSNIVSRLRRELVNFPQGKIIWVIDNEAIVRDLGVSGSNEVAVLNQDLGKREEDFFNDYIYIVRPDGILVDVRPLQDAENIKTIIQRHFCLNMSQNSQFRISEFV